jgi:polysaccharide biosynthesis transport protein
LEQQLATLNNELTQVRARTIEASTRAASLAEMQRAGKLQFAPEVLSSPPIQRLKEVLAAALGKPVGLMIETRSINEQMEAEAMRILEGAKVDARSWAERQELLQHELDIIQAKITAIHKAELELEPLVRESANDKAVLDDAEKQLKSQVAATRSVGPDLDVLTRPDVPYQAAFPNPILSALATLVAACLAGAAMIWRTLAKMARRMTTEQDGGHIQLARAA